MMRDGLAALAPEAKETTVEVGLGARSYDIVIGERLLDEAGPRIAAALPGARCAVVSDANVAALYLPRLKASLGGLFLGDVVVAPGEQSKSFPVLADVCERLLELGVERGDMVDRARRRRGRRPCRLCRKHPAARRPPRADADDAARPGRLLGRRQDRHRHAARQESDRQPSISRAWCSPISPCWRRSPPASFVRATPR